MDYLKTKGRIFNIQRYSIHDGKGIRTIIFLKGCFLRCKWCCNPESQNFEIENRNLDGKIIIEGRDVTVQEVLEVVAKDVPYYRRSGGGVTLSGGECLFQPEFARDILKGAKERGIHTAIETTSATKWETIEMILPYVDQYLMDIKHMDSRKHKEYTGSGNELILENARKIAERYNGNRSSNYNSNNSNSHYKNSNLTIRVPIIPSFNNQPSEIKEIANFTATLNGVTQIHLLPYHRLGQGKYQQLNRSYNMLNILPPTIEEMSILKEVVETQTNLKCQIGG